jgi:lycopene cyclase domain-containing protein
MTYFEFLLRFLLLPILVFLGITYWDHRGNRKIRGFRNGGAVWSAITVHVLLAVTYTTPWDNYLVATGVWYYNPNLVTGILLGYVPIEEYTFFVVETILSGLWWWFLARRIYPGHRSDFSAAPRTENFEPNRILVYLATGVVLLIWLVFTYLFFLGDAQWTYLSITLFWALPPIVIQLLFGADILWQYRKLVFWAILIPGVYLSLMDIIALQETTWSISPGQTTGILFFGILPLEEVVFFFITNIMITFGMTLLLANVSQERFAEIKSQIQAWREKRGINPQAR